MPKVSIITVTYNCRELLKNTIDCISDQSYRDIEHIIIDGNSNDGTVEVILSNKNKISYWVSEPDNGIYDAMNKGLKAAKGDYILFLNAGDTFYDVNTLNNIQFTKYPLADIFYGETMMVDQNGNQLGLRRKKLPYDLSWQHFKQGMVVCHQSVFVKREIAPPFDLKYRYAADIEWVLCSLKNSKQVIFTNSIISNFVEGGFSNQNLVKSWIERFIILKVHFGLFQSIISHFSFFIDRLFVIFNIIPLYRKIKL